jgi:uncharacterized SAM-binding protein YcdF (DUF218 family)
MSLAFPGPLPSPRWLRRLPLLGLIVLALGFGWFAVGVGSRPAEPTRRTDGIAVLTGGAERIGTGLALLREGQAERLLISGVHRDVTLADLLPAEDQGLAARVALGHDAASTRGNAAEIAAWVRATGQRSVRVVTAGYHMPRALLELRRALPEVALVPHPVLPARLREPGAVATVRTWSLLLGEYLKYLGAALGLSPPEPPRAPA